MAAISLVTTSPFGEYQKYLTEGKLAYQESASGKAVFYPRVCAPGTGEALTWKISKGLGEVYSTTVIYKKDVQPYNVALINLDEGFRMMSRVEGIAPEAVKIGMRVKFVAAKDKDGNPLAIFNQV
ncbi:Zn-ribbon domain-containing OB-fold protein [Polynucleobacter sp. Latsch14-2]|uniref:Zn-ribbon domain-containing OB-fold protein n=1 Tax=Polynucleobacter sp. Latsch14-2 TaxID=2576920 RepID=UPI00351D449C